MSLRIHFARHGESHANLLGEISNRGLKHGLTRLGRQQAKAIANRFQGHAITRIYSSPLLRAIETSVILAAELEVEYEISEALREFDCGIMEGRSDSIAWGAWQGLFDAWKEPSRRGERIENGESFYDVQARFEPFITELMRRHDNDDEVICISHGGLYMQMLPVVLKNIDMVFLSHTGFGNTDHLTAELRPEGLIAVEWNGQSLELGSLNN
ncbi:MAG TPA: histidine phosphatase family protein [Anaerolineales bacterium]